MAPLIRRSKPKRGKIRVPTTNYHLKQRPYQIQPFFIAPVLPGESVQNMLWKQTTISDPVSQRLMGWHQEFHLFYVRVRDCFPGTDMKQIFIDPEANLSALYSAADPKYFHAYGVNWAKEACRLVTKYFFRAEDEAPEDHLVDGLFAASIGTDNYLDSALLSSAYDAGADVSLDIGTDHIVEMSDIEKSMRMYEMLKAGTLTDMTYEDFIATYGVRIPSAEQPEGKPKHLRTIKNWTMPANTVEPSTGIATTAMYWKSDERHDKDLFVKEPGFLIGFQVYRPKVLLGNITGSLSGIMDTAMEWLPAILWDDPTSSMIELVDGQSPVAAAGGNIMLDMKDYLIYGEQFTNLPLNTADMNIIAMPAAGLQKRYPSLAMAQSVFVDDAGGGTKQWLETDGRIDITIRGNLTDTTPSVSRLEV